MDPDDVNVLRPSGVASTPTVTTAAIATTAAATRQNVSLRRILRRSTITSESSDIEILPGSRPRGAARFPPHSPNMPCLNYINCDAI